MREQDIQLAVSILKRLVTKMISHPENLVINHFVREGSLKITIQAHAADTPRLIGAGRANFNGLTTILNFIGARIGVTINLPPIKEPVVGTPERYKFKPNPEWPREEIFDLVRDTAKAVFNHPEMATVVEINDDSTFSTEIDLRVSRGEPEGSVVMMQKAMKTIFDAIGKANGRFIYLTVVPNVEVETPQPASASGRYAAQTEN